MVDLNGDGELDLFEGMADGTLVVSLGIGERQFEHQQQELPRAIVTDIVAGDLNDDGLIDLYLVTPRANIVLVGDGAGFFSEATIELGLRDEGLGVSATSRDLDRDGRADLLLFNETGDVIFWGMPGGFERDTRTPFVPFPAVQTDSSVPTIQLLSAGGQILAKASSSKIDVSRSLSDALSPGRRSLPIDTTAPLLQKPINPQPTAEAPLLSLSASAIHTVPIESARGLSPLKHGLTPEQQQILSLLSIVDLPDGVGGIVKTVRLTGANFQVVNGLGATDSLNGLGNLIVGYNELRGVSDNRTGSHNIVGGNENNYTAAAGHVVGEQNDVSGFGSSVSGGSANTALGDHSSVSGGNRNTVSGTYASVSGGRLNTASGYAASVSGGINTQPTELIPLSAVVDRTSLEAMHPP